MTRPPSLRALVGVSMLTGILVSAHPVHAQGAAIVHDPVIYIQTLRQFLQLLQQHGQVQAQRELWERLARPLPADRPARYVVPGTPGRQSRGTADDDLFGLYTALRAAIEHGDPTGQRWMDAGIPFLPYPVAGAPALTATQRLHRARLSTHPLTTDGLGTMAVHALAYHRDGHQATTRVLDQLSARLAAAGDRGNPALLQQIAAADWHGAHEEHLRNVYLAYLVEGRIADLKRQRDAQVRALLMHVARRHAVPLLAQQTTLTSDQARRDLWRRRP